METKRQPAVTPLLESRDRTSDAPDARNDHPEPAAESPDPEVTMSQVIDISELPATVSMHIDISDLT